MYKFELLLFTNSIIAIIFCIGLGFFVFLRKKNAKNFIYLIFNLNLSLWAVAMIRSVQFFHNPAVAVFYIRLANAIAIFLPANFFNFAISVGEELEKRKKIVLVYYITAVLLAATAFTPNYIKKFFYESPTSTIPQVTYGIAFLFVGIFVMWVLGHAIFYLFQRQKKSFGLKKTEIEYILSSVFVATIFTFVTVFLSPYFGMSYLSPLGPFSGVIISGIIAYGIAKHNILEVSFILQRTTVYAILVVLLSVLYAFIVFVFNWVVRGKLTPISPLFPSMAAAIMIAFAFSPLKEMIKAGLDKLFYKGKEQPAKVLSELSEVLSTSANISQSLKISLQKIASLLNVSHALIVLRNSQESDRFSIGASFGEEIKSKCRVEELNKENPLVKELKKGKILIREALERLPSFHDIPAAVSAMEKISAEVAVPFILKNELMGFLLLSRKEDRSIFSTQEVEFLHAISGQIGMVINNAELFQQLQRAERLAAAGVLAAGMAHEIRNPLVSIKTFVQLLPEKFKDAEFRQTFSQIASQEVDRINRLLENLMSFAKPKPLNLKKVDLVEVIDKTLFLLSNDLAAKDITLVKEYNKNGSIFIEGDEAQLRQVFSNLFLNGLQAMDNGGRLSVSIRLDIPGKRCSVSISDTGPGIAPENLSRIFDPFFSTKTGGTGLGLAIAHNIIREHRGDIKVQSIQDMGSTFTVELPFLTIEEEK